jgi:hypothetical protein
MYEYYGSYDEKTGEYIRHPLTRWSAKQHEYDYRSTQYKPNNGLFVFDIILSVYYF